MNIDEQLSQAIKPVAHKFLQENNPDEAIEQLLNIIPIALKQMGNVYRLKLFAVIQTTFDIHTGEEL